MWIRIGYLPNIRTPRSFNEKIAHRKLLQYDPRFRLLADKVEVRTFVRQSVGAGYLNEVYQVLRDPNDLRFSDLPRSFVVKAAHDSGSTLVVDDKTQISSTVLRKVVQKLLSRRFGREGNEYWYDEIPPGVIIEKRLRDRIHDIPLDFKIFVFHGHAQVIQVDHARFTRHTRTLYDREWRVLPVSYCYPQAPAIDRPKSLAEMVELAETLGKDFDFVRVDLYCLEGSKVIFGELTFSPEAGRGPFRPTEFDWYLGGLW